MCDSFAISLHESHIAYDLMFFFVFAEVFYLGNSFVPFLSASVRGNEARQGIRITNKNEGSLFKPCECTEWPLC